MIFCPKEGCRKGLVRVQGPSEWTIRWTIRRKVEEHCTTGVSSHTVRGVVRTEEINAMKGKIEWKIWNLNVEALTIVKSKTESEMKDLLDRNLFST